MAESPEWERGTDSLRLVRMVPPFVGRQQYLDWFETCLQEVLAGQPRLLLIAGAAGIGKTRLLKEIQARARRDNVQVCAGRCYEDISLPYLPFIETWRSHWEQTSEDIAQDLKAELETVRRLIQGNHTLSPVLSSSLPMQADQDKLWLFLAVSRITIRLSQRCPTLFVVDDLHWMDPPSLELFSHLVFAIADAAVREAIPLLIIGTYRPVELEGHLGRMLSRLAREDLCQTSVLPGLNESEMRDLLRGLGLLRPSHHLVTTMSEATGGSPLFIQEVLRYLMQHNALQEREGYVVTTSSVADLRLPTHVTAALLDHTQRLSDTCRRVLTLASLLGEHFSPQVLGAVSGLDEDELLNVLEEGTQEGLLLSEGQMFHFTHPLTRHVFYHEPSTARRQRLHWQIAQTLERLYSDNLAAHLLTIAHHLVRAGSAADAGKVLHYVCLAGDQAFAVFDWGNAARYYTAVLSVAESAGLLTPQRRAELHYRVGLAYFRDGDMGPCLIHYEQAIAAYQVTGNVEGLAQALMGNMETLFRTSASYGTLGDMQPLEDILRALGEYNPRLRGNLMTAMSDVYWLGRQGDKATEMAKGALEIGRQFQDDLLCASAHLSLGMVYSQNLLVQEALESYQQSRICAQRSQNLWVEGEALQRIPAALVLLGRFEEAEAVAAEAYKLASQTNNWGPYSLTLSALTYIAVARGNFAMAEKHAHETMVMVSRSRFPFGGAMALPAVACARTLCGAWTAAEKALDMLMEPGQVFEKPGSSYKAITSVYRQLIQAYRGANEDIQKSMSADMQHITAQERFDVISMASYSALIEIADTLGTPVLSERPLCMLAIAVERGILFSRGWMFLIPRVLGVAMTLNQWWDKAEGCFQTALDAATKIGALPELGRTYLDYARMLAARGKKGDHSQAVELLRQARDILHDLGMAPFVWRATHLARELLGSSSRELQQRPPHHNHLSTHEVTLFTRMALSDTIFLR